MTDASRVVNATLGDIHSYTNHQTGTITPELNIKVTKTKMVRDEFGLLVGVRMEASILKSEYPDRPRGYDEIHAGDGSIYIVGDVIRETSSKWTVVVMQNG